MAEPEKKESGNGEGKDTVFDVHLTYNLETNDFKLDAPNVPTIMLYGIIQMGLNLGIQNQVKLQIMKDLVEANAKKLGEKPKIAVVPPVAIPKGMTH